MSYLDDDDQDSGQSSDTGSLPAPSFEIFTGSYDPSDLEIRTSDDSGDD